MQNNNELFAILYVLFFNDLMFLFTQNLNYLTRRKILYAMFKKFIK